VVNEEDDFSFCSVTTVVYRFVAMLDRASIILARSTVVGSYMAKGTEVAATGGVVVGGWGKVVAAVVGYGGGWVRGTTAAVDGGGGAGEDEDRLEPDTRLSRAWNP
jgi:hypothetical protein